MRTIERISRGGFGVVDKVMLDDGVIVARKTFDPDPRQGYDSDTVTKLRRRFEREVKAQAMLRGNFVPILASDLGADPPWFTMPLAKENFASRIQQDRKSGQISSEPLADILNGLQQLERLGFVHRDLKPENVLLIDNQWRISDLGLVLLPSSTMTTQLTSEDSGWQTTEYCAPEQHLDFRRVTAAADIYSFGCILHDLVVGARRLPYQRHTGPGDLGRIIEKCTEADPKKRFGSIAALRSALLTALARPQNLVRDADAVAWANELEAAWDVPKLEEFVRFLNGLKHNDERAWDVFVKLDETRVEQLHQVDGLLWESVALSYCEWAKGSFAYSYCDVIIGRLRKIFDIGSLSVKGAAAIAAAKLGQSHNRYFVMRQVCDMCDGALPDEVAQRVAIEIRIEEAEAVFRRCASQSSLGVRVYHRCIKDVVA